MKKQILVLLIVISNITFAQTDSILFIGNSYTYVSDIPGEFTKIATSAGKSVFIDSYTVGGYTTVPFIHTMVFYLCNLYTAFKK